MSGGAITSPDLDACDLAGLIDAPVRNILTVLSMEMDWDQPVRSAFRTAHQRISIVAQWWAGDYVTGVHTVFGAVKVMLWRNPYRGVYLEVVTDCPLPETMVETLCQSLQAATDVSVSWRGAIEGIRKADHLGVILTA